jgi:hypothetical protein
MYYEAVFLHAQELERAKSRTGLIPKDDGLGVMISAFVSREFGYGMVLTSN